MANWDKTVDKNGQEFIEINGKLYPCQTLEPHETLKDPEAFRREMQNVRREYAIKAFRSILALEDIILM